MQDVRLAVDVLTDIVINRPCAEVAAYAGDPSHTPQWYVNIESVDWRTPEPVTVGSRMDFVTRFLGRRLAYTYEVVELVAGERLVMRTAQGAVSDRDDVHLAAGRPGPDTDDAAESR